MTLILYTGGLLCISECSLNLSSHVNVILPFSSLNSTKVRYSLTKLGLSLGQG